MVLLYMMDRQLGPHGTHLESAIPDSYSVPCTKNKLSAPTCGSGNAGNAVKALTNLLSAAAHSS